MKCVFVKRKRYPIAAIPDEIKKTICGGSFDVRVITLKEPIHDGYPAECKDADMPKLRQLAENSKMNFFPFCDDEGSDAAIIDATLRDYGLTTAQE